MKNRRLHHILNSVAIFYFASNISTVLSFCNYEASSSGKCHQSRRSQFSLMSQHPESVPCSIHESTRSAAKSNILAIAALSTILLSSRIAVASDVICTHVLLSDELEVKIDGAYLGIGLTELEYGDKKNTRVCVQSVKDNADEKVVKMVKPGMILVAVDGENVEGQSRSQVIETIKIAERPLSLVFRDRERFFQMLNSTISRQEGVIQTAISPSEILRVERLERGSDVCLRSAAIGDVLELSYQVRLQGTKGERGLIVDGAVVIAAEGSRPSEENLYIVLTPSASIGSSTSYGVGALPAGWEVSARGMCVGERRLITLPASLAFGKEARTLKNLSTAIKSTGSGAGSVTKVIPPNSPIVIDVRLLSLNGVA